MVCNFIFDCVTVKTENRIDGITGMSRGISEGKQKKKLPIRLKAFEFFLFSQNKMMI